MRFHHLGFIHINGGTKYGYRTRYSLAGAGEILNMIFLLMACTVPPISKLVARIYSLHFVSRSS
jgi:hypothetical protein